MSEGPLPKEQNIYETDCPILTKEENLDKTLITLREKGYAIGG